MNEFKLIVSGGRDFNNNALLSTELEYVVNKLLTPYDVSLVSGMAKGADMLAYNYAITNNIHIAKFPANWDKYGNSAGYIRNAEMASFANGLIAFWNGKSPGTKHMIEIMRELGKFVYLVNY